jgi:hypothetical protein
MTKDEALKLALEAITTYLSESPDASEEAVEGLWDAVNVARKALAQSEQDCVGWFGYDTGLRLWFETNKGDDDAIPLYKDPQQRTWVGLTPPEIEAVMRQWDYEAGKGGGLKKLVAITEAKLKELNK